MTNKFSPEVADKLLDKLSTDQNFRDLFERNPRAALKQVGHETSDADRDIKGQDPVMCAYNLGPSGLASMEAIRSGRDKIKAALALTPPFTVFMLSAS